jgi:hypothetical protein
MAINDRVDFCTRVKACRPRDKGLGAIISFLLVLTDWSRINIFGINWRSGERQEDVGLVVPVLVVIDG